MPCAVRGLAKDKVLSSYLQSVVQLFTDHFHYELGLFCWIQQRVRKSHSAFNKATVSIAEANSIFKGQTVEQISSFSGQVQMFVECSYMLGPVLSRCVC